MIRLSIIIPMYKVEPFVERCLRSLEKQDIPRNEYEIICVNDGSPDNSREVVIRFQKDFENIALIDQENKGVSQARNTGINKSIGKYLLFIDPDDFVDADSFGRILKTADEQNAQVSFLGFTFLNEDYTKRKELFNESCIGKIFSGKEAYFFSRKDGQTDPDRMVAVLFNREFFEHNNLRYLPNVPYLEDGEFIARILCLAERCIFDGHSFYQRTTRYGSATNSKLFYTEKASNGFVLAAINLKRFQQEEDLSRYQIEFLYQPIVKFVILSVKSCVGYNWIFRTKNVRNKLVENGLGKLKLDSCSNIYKMYGKVYNFCPYMITPLSSIYIRLIIIRKKFNALISKPEN